jgi:hypothetical protein
MDVPAVAPASTGQSEGVAPTQTVAAAPQAPAPSLASSSSAAPKPVPNSTIAEAVAKIYNVSSGSSGQPQLAISYKYVSEVAQFPPQELIGLAEFFDQIDGVTLDRKV